jgi:hypothetical protein
MKELPAIGEAAAVEKIPRIRQLLNRLDPELVPASADAPAEQKVGSHASTTCFISVAWERARGRGQNRDYERL